MTKALRSGRAARGSGPAAVTPAPTHLEVAA